VLIKGSLSVFELVDYFLWNFKNISEARIMILFLSNAIKIIQNRLTTKSNLASNIELKNKNMMIYFNKKLLKIKISLK
jgi:hypothetical protein